MTRHRRAQAIALVEALATADTSHQRIQVLAMAQPILRDMSNRQWTEMASALPVVLHCLRRAVHSRDWKEVQGLADLLTSLPRDHDTLAQTLADHFRLAMTQGMLAIRGGPAMVQASVTALLEGLMSVCGRRLGRDTINGAIRLLLGIIGHPPRHQREELVRGSLALLIRLVDATDRHVDLVQYPGLCAVILTLPPGPWDDGMAWLLDSLACKASNRAIMAQTTGLLPRLVELYDTGGSPSRRHVLAVIRRLAFANNSKTSIVACHGLLESVVAATRDDQLQYEALSTLRSLIDRDSALRIRSVDLFSHLRTIAMPIGRVTTGAASIAAQCFKKIASYTAVNDDHFQDLMECISMLIHSKVGQVREWAATSYLDMSRKLSHAFWLVREAHAMAAINALARDNLASVRARATEALTNLLSSTVNLKRIVLQESILTTITDNTEDVCDKTRGQAIVATLMLVHYAPLRPRVAKQSGLAACLSQFGVSNHTNVELRKAALQGVILLTPFL